MARFLLLSVLFSHLPLALTSAALRPELCSHWEAREVRVELPAAGALRAEREGTRLLTSAPLPDVLPFEGLALPGAAYFTDGVPDHGDPILWHELAHQYQYRRDGVLGFAVSYLTDLRAGLLHGCSPSRAYRAVGAEVEARAIMIDFVLRARAGGKGIMSGLAERVDLLGRMLREASASTPVPRSPHMGG